MADKKISELVSITGSATAADDYFVVVDTSGAVTHKISRAELNNAIEQDVLENISITNLTSDLNTNGNDIKFADNDKAIFGAGSDLQIYHDGFNSIINDAGTGSLKFQYGGTDGVVFDSSGNVNVGMPAADTSSNYISVTGGLAGSELNAQIRFYGKSVSNTGATYETGRISGGSTSSSYALSGGLVFYTSENNGSNVLTLSERLRIKSNGQIHAAAESQSIATFGARKSGAAIEFGHANNTAGYYGTLGSYGASGIPYIGFSADAEDSVNTFTTRGFKGNLIVGGSDGSLTFSQLTNASATGQTPTSRMRIDPSGSVNIGGSGGQAKFEINNAVSTTGSLTDTTINLATTGVTGRKANIGFGLAGGVANTNAATIGFDVTNGAGALQGDLFFSIRGSTADSVPTERMRLTSAGDFLVASTSATDMWRGLGQNGTHLGATYCASQYGSNTNLYMSKPSGYSNATYIEFWVVGSGVGSISTNGSSTSYNTSSDYRLKENVTADWDATTRLKQLNPVRFNFISDADTTVDGFLAHEVQDIVPEAISGTKDAVDDEGNPVYQGIDQSKLTPLLTKALIEAVEKIEQLEARITALETN